MLAPSQIFRAQRARLAQHAAEPYPTIEQLLDEIRHRNPMPAAYVELAGRYERRGELQSAVTILDEALAVCAPAEDLYAKAIFVLEQGNRTDDAIRLAHRARTLFPGARWFELWERLMLPVLYTSPSHL